MASIWMTFILLYPKFYTIAGIKVNEIISGTITLSHRYNTNEELYQFLDSYYSYDMNYLVEYQNRIGEAMFSDLAYNRHVRKISLYTDNPTVFNGSIVNKISSGDIVTLGEDLIDYRRGSKSYLNLPSC